MSARILWEGCVTYSSCLYWMCAGETGYENIIDRFYNNKHNTIAGTRASTTLCTVKALHLN